MALVLRCERRGFSSTRTRFLLSSLSLSISDATRFWGLDLAGGTAAGATSVGGMADLMVCLTVGRGAADDPEAEDADALEALGSTSLDFITDAGSSGRS